MKVPDEGERKKEKEGERKKKKSERRLLETRDRKGIGPKESRYKYKLIDKPEFWLTQL